MNRDDFFIDNDNAWESFAPGVYRKITGFNDNLMMVKVKFEKGATVPAHRHPHVQCSLIESGRFEVISGGKSRILKKGDGFFVPSDVEHKVTAVEQGIIIDTFHPAREDFIQKK